MSLLNKLQNVANLYGHFYSKLTPSLLQLGTSAANMDERIHRFLLTTNQFQLLTLSLILCSSLPYLDIQCTMIYSVFNYR